MPTPAMMNGARRVEYETVGVTISGQPAERDRLQREPGRHQRPAADRGRTGCPATGATNIVTPGPREHPHAGAERRVALHGLEELRQQEDRAEHAEVHRDRRRRSWRRTRGCGRSAAAASAPACGSPTRRRRRRARRRRRSRAEHLGRAPAVACSSGRRPRRCRRGRRPRATRPAMSSLSSGPFVSRRWIQASGIVTRPIGTLSQKIHCQAMPSTIAPPTTGPIATARPAMPPHAPRIAPRFSRGVPRARIVSVSGVTIARAEALERARARSASRCRSRARRSRTRP